jgi:hypothetical protein
VPRIVEGGFDKVVPLAQIFVDAIHHIPSHRRLLLFAMVIHSLSFHHLSTMLFLLMRKSIADEYDGKEADDQAQDIPSFCATLCAGFSPLAVINAFSQILGMAVGSAVIS